MQIHLQVHSLNGFYLQIKPKKCYVKPLSPETYRWTQEGFYNWNTGWSHSAQHTEKTVIFSLDFQFVLAHFPHTFLFVQFLHVFLCTVSFPRNFSASTSTNQFSSYSSFLFSTKQILRRELLMSKLLTKLQRETNETALKNILLLGYFS